MEDEDLLNSDDVIDDEDDDVFMETDPLQDQVDMFSEYTSYFMLSVKSWPTVFLSRHNRSTDDVRNDST